MVAIIKIIAGAALFSSSTFAVAVEAPLEARQVGGLPVPLPGLAGLLVTPVCLATNGVVGALLCVSGCVVGNVGNPTAVSGCVTNCLTGASDAVLACVRGALGTLPVPVPGLPVP